MRVSGSLKSTTHDDRCASGLIHHWHGAFNERNEGRLAMNTDETTEPPRPDPKRRRGLIIVNTGDGKGKTTAALGLAFRALGSGFKVFMLQYIKGKWKTGEKKLADRLYPEI